MNEEPQINLAKCKIGQRVRLRNGKICHIEYIGSKTMAYPYQLNTLSCHMASGRYYGASQQSRLDIVALLPLPKKKAPPRLQKALKLPAPLDKQAIKAAIKTLQALLK
jgi:hypothetical protein